MFYFQSSYNGEVTIICAFTHKKHVNFVFAIIYFCTSTSLWPSLGMINKSQIHHIKYKHNKNSKNSSHLREKECQWHACLIAIQLGFRRCDKNALFQLDEIPVFFFSNNGKVFSSESH